MRAPRDRAGLEVVATCVVLLVGVVLAPAIALAQPHEPARAEDAGSAYDPRAIAAADERRPEARDARGRERAAALATRLRDLRAKTTVIVSAGVSFGLGDLAGAQVSLGAVVPAGAEVRDEGSPRVSVFGLASGHLGPLAVTPSLSPDRRLRGVEWSLGPLARRSPIYGDRTFVPIIPFVLSLAVSRKGGFGLNLSAIPLPIGPFPLVGGNFSAYVDHPALRPLSAHVLDGVDRIGRALSRVVAPLRLRRGRARSGPGLSSDR